MPLADCCRLHPACTPAPLSLCLVPLLVRLPRNAAAAAKPKGADLALRKKTWPYADGYAVTTLTLIGCAIVYSFTVNLLSMFPETMCLKFAGGEGCVEQQAQQQAPQEAPQQAQQQGGGGKH